MTVQQFIKFLRHPEVRPSYRTVNTTQAGWMRGPAGAFLCVFLTRRTQRPSPPLFPLTSPALLLVVLAEDAALGVGERCRVTRAMVGGLQLLRGSAGGEEKGGEQDVGRCAAEIVSVTGEKMPSQTLIQQHLTPEPWRCSLSVLLRASSAATGVFMSRRSSQISSVCTEPTAKPEISSLVRRQTKHGAGLQAGQK